MSGGIGGRQFTEGSIGAGDPTLNNLIDYSAVLSNSSVHYFLFHFGQSYIPLTHLLHTKLTTLRAQCRDLGVIFISTYAIQDQVAIIYFKSLAAEYQYILLHFTVYTHTLHSQFTLTVYTHFTHSLTSTLFRIRYSWSRNGC